MHRGYVKMWRKIEDSGLWKKDPPTALKVFQWLLMHAAWKDTQLKDGTVLKRGQGQARSFLVWVPIPTGLPQ